MPLLSIGKALEPRDAGPSKPDWVAASPVRIEAALRRALEKPTGGWFVLGASRDVGDRPASYRVDGRNLVAWRGRGVLFVAPSECPHMGADLCAGRVDGDALVCPWHGLRLGPDGHGRWRPLPAHDDGVLAWVRLDGAEAPTAAPILAPRPSARTLHGVIRVEARCEPEDVIANRLDPWHGVHFHPHSFARLRVLEETDESILVRVAYRVAGPLVVEVDATFHVPERRTIVMTIVGGDGRGSVVETHATPIDPGRTAIIEATIATSDRPGFGAAAALGPLVRPFIEARARRLWVDDAAYCERRSSARSRER